MAIQTTLNTDTNNATLAAIRAAVNMAGHIEEPVVVPQGELGGCVACGHTVMSHFREGRFIGCLKGTTDTVFILVPATRTASRKATERRALNGAKVVEVAHDMAVAEPVKKLGLSPVRTKVLAAIHENTRTGLLAKDIMKKAKLPHGSVQQTLNWLRNHKVNGRTPVEAREDRAAA